MIESSPDAPADDRLVVVTGATGYVGGRLVPRLLEAGHRVRCIARDPAKLAGRPWRDQVEVVAGSLDDPDDAARALDGATHAYYLVHSMSADRDYREREAAMAATFAEAAGAAGLRQIVYLGGLGDDDELLSEHLASRHSVGRILADGPTPVTELRAAIILGSGSASFEMLRSLVEVLPVMVVPRWVDATRCQPIAIGDVLVFLVGVLDNDDAKGRVLDMGGPEILTYREMMDVYAEEAGLRRRLIVSVPVLTPRLSAHWVNLVSPLPINLARALIGSLANDVVVTGTPVADVVPHESRGVREAIGLALTRIQDLDVTTRWSGAGAPSDAAVPDESDPDWAGGVVLSDRQEVSSTRPPAEVMAQVLGIGGERGWYVHNWLWSVRGLADKLVGGVGTRRGRRLPDQLEVGDALDFFRVEQVDPGHLLLRAEMKVPGHAWLEWRVEPRAGGSRLVQLARFVPRGVFGRLYWYALLPFHSLIFGRMAREIVARAEGS